MENQLKEKLECLGAEEISLIVHFKGEPSICSARLKEMGFEIKREFSLLKAFAVKGKASDALKLWDEPWVEAVEEDKPLKIL
ncbi:MAG: hypothetical protein RMK30_07975 [Anaerolineae bacterium]|nr:hypothetical protein [Anaerolineae bacterium]MDW8102798.1 hypothetical protein [Anaerolineae bacterium]